MRFPLYVLHPLVSFLVRLQRRGGNAERHRSAQAVQRITKGDVTGSAGVNVVAGLVGVDYRSDWQRRYMKEGDASALTSLAMAGGIGSVTE